MKLKLISLLLACMLWSGCAMNPKPVVGSFGQFDSDTYLYLVTTDTLIQSTKADLANNAFPASISDSIKKALNTLIASYDAADQAYIAYHNAASTGKETPEQQDAVNSSIAHVKLATSTLVTTKGVK